MSLWSHARHGVVEQAILNQLAILTARSSNQNGVHPDDVAAALSDLVTRPEFDDGILRSRGLVFATSQGRLRVRAATVGAARSIHAVDHFR